MLRLPPSDEAVRARSRVAIALIFTLGTLPTASPWLVAGAGLLSLLLVVLR